MDEDLLALLLFLFILMGVLGMFATRRQSKTAAKKARPVTFTGANAAAQTAASTAKIRATDPGKIVEDVRMMQTSRVVDAIQVLDELGEANPGYRHYCELIGNAQKTGGVTAPYSKRQVAYYDLRCYRMEVRNGQDVETLVAREKSIDPFFLEDGTSGEPVYIDLESFGDHCILVNATNRVEGPKSDFSKRFSDAMGAVDGRTATGVPGVMAFTGLAAQWIGEVKDRIVQGARICLSILSSKGLVPAEAPAGATSGLSGKVASDKRANVAFAYGYPGGPGYPGGMGRPPMPPTGRRPGYPYGTGGARPGYPYGTSGMPRGAVTFLGPTINSGYLGGPRYHKNDDLEDAMSTLLGMGIGALIGSLSTAETRTSGYGTATNVESINGFRGYRIIEDVVPLGCPIYALGEIYRNGREVHIGRSVSTSYPSSYFATKPEAEVIAALS